MHAQTAIMPPEKKKASLYVLVISLRKPRKIKINQKHKLARFSMKDMKEFKIKAKSSVIIYHGITPARPLTSIADDCHYFLFNQKTNHFYLKIYSWKFFSHKGVTSHFTIHTKPSMGKRFTILGASKDRAFIDGWNFNPIHIGHHWNV